jgi:hypothetical protein
MTAKHPVTQDILQNSIKRLTIIIIGIQKKKWKGKRTWLRAFQNYQEITNHRSTSSENPKLNKYKEKYTQAYHRQSNKTQN